MKNTIDRQFTQCPTTRENKRTKNINKFIYYIFFNENKDNIRILFSAFTSQLAISSLNTLHIVIIMKDLFRHSWHKNILTKC